MSISKIFIPNFARVLTNKRKYIEHSFYSGAGVMPQGWDLGVLGVKHFSVGICDGAPSTALSSFFDKSIIYTYYCYAYKSDFLGW